MHPAIPECESACNWCTPSAVLSGTADFCYVRVFIDMVANSNIRMMRSDSNRLTRKIKLRSSPVHVNYHPETGTYILVTKERVAVPYAATMGNEELPKEDETAEMSDRYIPPDHDKFALQLVSPNGWVIIPNTLVELDMFDNVTCCKVLGLRDATATGKKDFVVVGISRVGGEEVTARGKVMILDVSVKRSTANSVCMQLVREGIDGSETTHARPAALWGLC